MERCSEILWGPIRHWDPFETQFDLREPAQYFEANRKTPPGSLPEDLVVATWNIKFGGGRVEFFFEREGGRVTLDRSEVLEHLSGIATAIRFIDPDILLVQEIDIGSRRTAFIDQVQWLLDRTPMNFASYASQWRSKWIPRYGIGRIDSGNAIFSKWSLDSNVRISLPQIEDQSPLTKYFFLKRNILASRLNLPDRDPVHFFNTHLSALPGAEATKKRQLEILKMKLDEYDLRETPLILGGDLNALPPGARHRRDFPDEDDGESIPYGSSDYSGEEDWLVPFYRDYHPCVPLETYTEDELPHYTYSGDEDVFWNRKLDYLFSNRALDGALVYQNRKRGGVRTRQLSDHAPLSAKFRAS